VQDLVDSFRRSPSFAGIDQAGLQALAASTLRWNDGPKLYELACAREFEASIFAMQDLEGAWDKIASVTLPVLLVAARQKDGAGPFARIERSLAAAGGFAFTTVADTTHFMQIEKPAECAAIVTAFHAGLTA
jgi:pimeloyl-ACP methyl ester carboxylesterase